MSLKVHVFYGAQYLSDLKDLDQLKKVPDGAYVKMNNNWFQMLNNALTRMPKPVELPPEILAQLALMSEGV